MGAGTLTIYSASAGSGKTYNLAGAYLEKLFLSRYSYRKILAVTFTHKATAEMKSRILEELNKLAVGSRSKYLTGLIQSTGKDEKTIRREAGEILYMILHDYSRFSVSTIDSFFQKILRAFVRDIGLHSGFNIELDHSLILALAVDKMIDSAAVDPLVKKWLTGYVRSNIEDEKSWDVRKNIISLAAELFNEKFRLLSEEEKTKLQDKDFLTSYINEMRSISSRFEREMKNLGKKCLSIISRFNLQDDLFYYRGRGVPGFVRSLAEGIIRPPNTYVREIECNPPRWSKGETPALLMDALCSGLEESVKAAIRYYDSNVVDYNSANTILTNIYTLGILSDVLKQVRIITKDENTFLLSDTPELIYLITRKDQTPFIYEKVGNAFENFMIDEFQDTSKIQWKNFEMLIGNSMSQGFDNLLVGDVKQSIYRWRNSNWQTLRDLNRSADNKRIKSLSLDTNWRSCENIIKFNNELFSIIPRELDFEFTGKNISSGFSELFSSVSQKDPQIKKGGYVRLEFVPDPLSGKWQEIVLDKLPEVIRTIYQKGYNPSDIGILVRDNSEGARILKKIIGYASSLPEEEKKKFNIVSNDSLLLVNAPVVTFIVAILQVLDNPDNMIARALMLRNFLLATGKADAEKADLECDNLISYSACIFPSGYENFLNEIRFLTLWDITEKTIRFFGLGNYTYNVPYLNSFQDIIINFASGKNQGVPSFIDWWQTEGAKKSISLPEQQDAIRVLTIHKSKGLEFGVVILPFLAWNLDHKSFHSNILWVKPGTFPFSRLGIVPVRYKSDLAETIFSEDYFEEKYSAYVDNINLLYVALTRAENGIYGFAPDHATSDSRIAEVIKDAVKFNEEIPGIEKPFLFSYLNPETKVFEFGELPGCRPHLKSGENLYISHYPVSADLESLKLKLHWENYLVKSNTEVRARINYGKLMHEIFEEIISFDDIKSAVRKKVLEGELPEEDEAGIMTKITDQVNRPGIKDWFEKGNEVLNEASILLPGGATKRPDRIILRGGKTIIVDFKFGDENPHYFTQINQYKHLLTEMGYNQVEAFLWYVDSEKIVQV